jgi:Zn/Cd-binding protein ZinT
MADIRAIEEKTKHELDEVCNKKQLKVQELVFQSSVIKDIVSYLCYATGVSGVRYIFKNMQASVGFNTLVA